MSRKTITNRPSQNSCHNPASQLRRCYGLRSQHRIYNSQHHRLRLRAYNPRYRTNNLANPSNYDRRRQAPRRLRGLPRHQHQLPLPDVRMELRLGESIRRDLPVELHLRGGPTVNIQRQQCIRPISQPPSIDESLPVLEHPRNSGRRVPELQLREHDERCVRWNRQPRYCGDNLQEGVEWTTADFHSG